MDKVYIDEKVRADSRLFAYMLGNSTLLPRNKGINLEYDGFLLSDNSAIGKVFAVFANNRRKEMSDSNINSIGRAAEWIVHECIPEYVIDPPIALWELLIEDRSGDVFEALKIFGLAFGRIELPHNIIHNVDYLSVLFDGGSFLEETVTIFVNNLIVDKEGRVVNHEEATRRASQYIRSYMDSEYQVLPPFKEWEVDPV